MIPPPPAFMVLALVDSEGHPIAVPNLSLISSKLAHWSLPMAVKSMVACWLLEPHKS